MCEGLPRLLLSSEEPPRWSPSMTQHEQTAPVGAPVPVVHAVPVTLPLIGTITALPERTSAIATRVLKISQLLVLLEIVTAIVSIVHHGAARTPAVLSFLIGARARRSPARPHVGNSSSRARAPARAPRARVPFARPPRRRGARGDGVLRREEPRPLAALPVLRVRARVGRHVGDPRAHLPRLRDDQRRRDHPLAGTSLSPPLPSLPPRPNHPSSRRARAPRP